MARSRVILGVHVGWASWAAGALLAPGPLLAQSSPGAVQNPSPQIAPFSPGTKTPTPAPQERSLPINLATALQLAGATPLDIAVATQRLEAAAAQLDRANVLWVPTVTVGADYFRHDGRLQDVAGGVFSTSKSNIMAGAGPSMVFAVTDALYAPLAAKQVLRARASDLEASRNDAVLAVAEAYFNVQQARGELGGAIDTITRTQELVRRAERLAEGLTPGVEKNRALAELARRRQAGEQARERWQVASAELNRLLRLDAAALVEPIEAPQLRIELIDPNRPIDDLICLALSHRPELASQQALVQATLQRMKQEKMRPLVPSILIRGAATNPAGTLSTGVIGGGFNDNLSNFGARNSIDVQMIWELQNFGLGNRALVRERNAENQQAVLQLFRVQDRIASEVVQAQAQAQRAISRVRFAEDEVRNALITAEKNVEGLSQTRRVGEVNLLIFRPQEVVAAIRALDDAYKDYFGAVADANRAQFRLYRALGQTAAAVIPAVEESTPMPPTLLPPVPVEP